MEGQEFHEIEKDFKRELAITAARPRLARFGLLVWLLVDVGLMIFFFATVVLYLVNGTFGEQRVIATLGNNVAALHDAAAARAAEPLLVGDAKVLTRDVGSYDFYATLENPNSEWYATFSYTFDGVTPMTASIMPSEQRYVFALNVQADARPSATIDVRDVVWHRVDRHAIPNTAEFLVAHNNFVVENATYADTITIDSQHVGDASFTIDNATSYSFYNPTFFVVLERAGGIVGINQLTIPQFLAGERRDVSVHWFGQIPTTGSVVIIPVIDYFDTNSYMDPQGEMGADVRDTSEKRR